MRIGLWIDEEGHRIDEVGAAAKAAEDAGIDRIWFSQRLGWDALTLVAGVAPYTSTIRFAAGAVPVYPRHPRALAAQALSVQAISNNRLALVLGAGVPPVIEALHGLSMERPADYMREYVEALTPLLAGESANYQGDRITARGSIDIATAEPPELLLAALGPHMLRLAAESTAGTVTTWVRPDLIESYIRPRIGPGREIIATVCAALTQDADTTRRWIKERFGAAGDMPAYRKVMDRGGVAGPEDTAVLGDEETVTRELERFAAAGVTEFVFCPVGSPEEQRRTVEFAYGYAAGQQ
ncbi:LLM class flavin-dependent oxidoreductase [Kribbella sp. NPDC026611]|uniref:LLM class flavin-dependent oxidoreductase n=1 Tax=Kribbella sp. NPDC026611 TaxID=3154911 RepID=UPI0033F8AE23